MKHNPKVFLNSFVFLIVLNSCWDSIRLKCLSAVEMRFSARLFQPRTQGRYKSKLSTLLLISLLIGISLVVTKLVDVLRLPNIDWSICVDHSKQSDSNNNSCARLRINIFQPGQETSPISGKYVEDMQNSRDLTKFLLLPRVNDTTQSTAGCNMQDGDVKWTLVNVIKSSIGNTARRKAIRSTWGAVKIINGLRIFNVFVVGKNADVRQQASLKHESDLHGDILQLDLPDLAETVPVKVLAGMQWSSDSLKSDTLYSSMDDDVVIHIPNLATYLRREFLELQSCHPGEKQQTTWPDRPCLEDLPLLCVYGYKAEDTPERNSYSKWYISYSDYPGRRWPAYCRGGMYIAPVKMVDALFRASRRMEDLYLDDVWITGFMRRKLGMGDNNIVPAPHSTRHNLLLHYGILNSPFDILMEHMWGNMGDGADISKKIVDVWGKWKLDLDSGGICIPPAVQDEEFA